MRERLGVAGVVGNMSPSSLLVLSVSLCLAASIVESSPGNKPGSSSATLPPGILEEVASYQDVVEQIVDYSLNGPGANQSYDRLATFTDAFGSRLSGEKLRIYIVHCCMFGVMECGG